MAVPASMIAIHETHGAVGDVILTITLHSDP